MDGFTICFLLFSYWQNLEKLKHLIFRLNIKTVFWQLPSNLRTAFTLDEWILFFPTGKNVFFRPSDKKRKRMKKTPSYCIYISRFYTEANITSWRKLRFEQNTSYSVNTVKCPDIHPACFIHLKDDFCFTFVWQTNIC